MKPLTYRDAGVDLEAGDDAVRRIAPLARSTFRAAVLGGIGGFTGFVSLPPGYREPVLVSSTDGVGTKLKVAFLADRHNTGGIDLVAMGVNDVLVHGAEPLYFLDSIGTARLEPARVEAIVSGVARGSPAPSSGPRCPRARASGAPGRPGPDGRRPGSRSRPPPGEARPDASVPIIPAALAHGRLAAENIVADLAGRPLRSIEFAPRGMLVSLGEKDAVVEVMGVRFSGYPAWLFWNALHLLKLVGFRKQLQVALDWWLAGFFPRDSAIMRRPSRCAVCAHVARGREPHAA